MTDPLTPVPKLDLTAASDLVTALRLHKGQDIVVDMSQVTHLGALCMQALASAAATAARENHVVTLTNVSERVVEQLHCMGMTPETLTGGPQ